VGLGDHMTPIFGATHVYRWNEKNWKHEVENSHDHSWLHVCKQSCKMGLLFVHYVCSCFHLESFPSILSSNLEFHVKEEWAKFV